MDVDEVQENVIGDDFDMSESMNPEQVALAEDEEDYMPEGLYVDQSEIMLRNKQKRD